MALLTNRPFKSHLLFATLSAVGLTLGAIPLSYAQDVPTPTPPADGGTFEGAPDPTPGPEPESSTAEPTTDALPVSVPADSDTTDLPPDESPATDVLSEEAEPLPDATDPLSGGDAATPDVAEPGDNVEPITDADPETADPESNQTAPANNSPRGLW